MKRFYYDLRLSLIVAVLAFAVTWFVCNSFMVHQQVTHEPHQWLHNQLNLTAEQDEKLVPIEERFSSSKKKLEAQLSINNHELALAIKEDENYSPRVKAAVEKIHRVHVDLQQLTLEHLFEMHNVLTPEQRKKLNNLTTEALTRNP